MDITALLASEFSTDRAIVDRIIGLIDEGNTIPFIARYRKEMTGAMDDQKLREMSERLDYLRGLQKRREAIESAVGEQGKLTDDLRAKLAAAVTLDCIACAAPNGENCICIHSEGLSLIHI